MKRKTLFIIVILLLIMCLITGCTTDVSDVSKGIETNFGKVEGKDLLFYDLNTKVIYYLFQTAQGYAGYGYLAPYINENGSFCQYFDGKIVEIK